MESLLKKETKASLIKAIGHELYAHNLYRSLAAQMQAIGFFGTQKYFNSEAESELGHYQILVDYINDRGDVAEIPLVEAQKDKAKGLLDAFEIVYETEKSLLDFYVQFYESAEDKMKDCVTSQFLLQFIEIQRKAVGHYGDLLAKYKIAEETKEILEFDEHISYL
jgi:ferritin